RSCSFYQFARPTTLLGPVSIPVRAPMPPGCCPYGCVTPGVDSPEATGVALDTGQGFVGVSVPQPPEQGCEPHQGEHEHHGAHVETHTMDEDEGQRPGPQQVVCHQTH